MRSNRGAAEKPAESAAKGPQCGSVVEILGCAQCAQDDSRGRSRPWRTMAVAAALAAPAAANASEGAASPFAGDVGNALWTLVIFVLVVVLLGKYAWRPILTALKEREDFLRQNLEQARREREQAGAQLREYSEKLAAARVEASAIVDEGRRDAEAVRRRIEEEARQETGRLIERARREIGIAKETAVKELYTLSSQLAADIAGRILQREIRAEDHERLVSEAIAELDRQRTH